MSLRRASPVAGLAVGAKPANPILFHKIKAETRVVSIVMSSGLRRLHQLFSAAGPTREIYLDRTTEMVTTSPRIAHSER